MSLIFHVFLGSAMRLSHWVISVFLVVACAISTSASSADAGFAQWLSGFKEKAQKAGVSKAVLEQAFKDVAPNETVIKLDRKQPEGKITFSQYKANIVSKARIQEGKKRYQTYRLLLNDIAKYYQVPVPYILALWGVETNYGSFIGNTSTISALATLAYEGRRAEFFEKELLILLRLVQQKEVSLADLRGSWAGAIGHSQFMPSSFEKFAVDWNNNGKKDLWNELPDVFASIANYLHQEGWKGDVPWGIAIKKPTSRALVYDDLYTPRSRADLEKLGITLKNGAKLPLFKGNAYLMHPGEPEEGSYLVYDNYHVLLKWNRSRYFATAVGLLADAIAGQNGVGK